MTVLAPRIVLDSSAARTCPLKTQNAHLPWLEQPTRTPDPAEVTRAERREAHRERILGAWLEQTPGSVDLRGEDEEACRRALLAGVPLAVGGRLPADVGGRRVGMPDALVRGPDRRDSRPSYHPVVVKAHHILRTNLRESDPTTTTTARALRYGTFATPGPAAGLERPGYRLRTGTRRADFLQLSHYVRMLTAAGFGPPGPAWAGVIGSDPGEPMIGWIDLADSDRRPTSWLRRMLDRLLGSRRRPASIRKSFLTRYDLAFADRLSIAETARRVSPASPALLEPIAKLECTTCPWWEVCRPQLDDDDLSLRIERGRLRPREVIALRSAGVRTVTDLASADVSALLPGYRARLGEGVGDEPWVERRLRTAARRARLLVAGTEFVRETSGPIEVPAAEVEVDFDLETSADGRIYLWGFRVSVAGGEAYTRQFVRFSDLDAGAELELAREAMTWLRELQAGHASVRVYHYSGFEVAMIRALAGRPGQRRIAQAHYFGVGGLGLKAIAQHAGFRWRDPDPGGLNSQCWFAEAVHGPPEDRQSAEVRVLEYNEDDVLATSWLRGWLRAQ